MRIFSIRPYYWRSGNSAEVDFLLEDSHNRIMPLEAKSADNTKAKSLATYCRQYKPELAFKVSQRLSGNKPFRWIKQRDVLDNICRFISV